MDSMIVLYILGAVCLFVLVVLVASGLENIIKIILGNYILGSICFAANLALDSLIVSLGGLTGTTFISISATTRSAFLRNGQMTIIVVFYILLLILLYKKSTISIRLPHDPAIQKSLYLVLIPLALVSVVLIVYVILQGAGVLSPALLFTRSASYPFVASLVTFFQLTPLWIVLHGIATLLITAQIPVRIQTDVMGGSHHL